MKFAYFTLVSHEWMIGARAMLRSLREKTARPIEVLALPDMTDQDLTELESLGAKCKKVDRIGSKLAIVKPWHDSPDFCQNCFAKLHMWNTEYDKIIYLDADIIVTKNIDHLFYTEAAFSAVRSCAYVVDTHKNTAQAFLRDNHFNAGVLVLTPNKKTYDDLMEQKEFTNDDDGSDQSLLNIYFRHTWNRLPQIYNATRRLMNVMPDLWKEMEQDIHIIHYAAKEKPWLRKELNTNIDQIWWDYLGIPKESGPGNGT